jgi:hypothetical protein
MPSPVPTFTAPSAPVSMPVSGMPQRCPSNCRCGGGTTQSAGKTRGENVIPANTAARPSRTCKISSDVARRRAMRTLIGRPWIAPSVGPSLLEGGLYPQLGRITLHFHGRSWSAPLAVILRLILIIFLGGLWAKRRLLPVRITY